MFCATKLDHMEKGSCIETFQIISNITIIVETLFFTSPGMSKFTSVKAL